jgi:hypothetical protein
VCKRLRGGVERCSLQVRPNQRFTTTLYRSHCTLPVRFKCDVEDLAYFRINQLQKYYNTVSHKKVTVSFWYIYHDRKTLPMLIWREEHSLVLSCLVLSCLVLYHSRTKREGINCAKIEPISTRTWKISTLICIFLTFVK